MSQRSQIGFVHRRQLSRLAALGGTALILSSLLLTVAPTAVTATDIGTFWPAVLKAPNADGWTNPGNATGDPATTSGTFMQTDIDDADQGFGNFGITIPAGSIVQGITAKVRAYSDDNTGCRIQLQLDGGPGGSTSSFKNANGGATLTNALQTLQYGSNSDYWDEGWDPTQLTNTNLTLTVRFDDPSGGGCDDNADAYVDWVTLEIRYQKINGHTSNPGLSSDVCDEANFNFIIDMSGSIGEQTIGGVTLPTNLPDMKAGIKQFVEDFEDNGDGRYAATRFNANSATILTPNGYIAPGPFATNASNTVIGNLSNPSGLTPTGLGISTGAGNSTAGANAGQFIMFVVTDGSPNVPNTHSDDLTNPDTWLTGANAAIAAANAARGQYVVKAFYVSDPPADPGDTNLPFANTAGDRQWAESVMREIGGGTFLAGDFDSFVDELFEAIHCEPDIRVTKTGNGTIDAGATAQFSINVKNVGKGTAHDVTLSDQLPAGVAWAESPDHPDCSINGSGLLSCAFGDLIAGAEETVTVRGATDAADCGPLPNTAHGAASNEPGDVLGNNDDGTTVTVRCGSVKIVKDAVPNDPQDFSFSTSGTGGTGLPASFTLDDDADGTLPNQETYGKVKPGAYTITEGAVGGWSLTDLVCTGDPDSVVNKTTRTATLDVDAGENIVCTYTNTKLGSITVEKQTSPDGAPGNFTFTGNVAGTIADNGTIVVNDLLPGTYTSTEADPAPPFDLGQITCNDGGSATPSTWNLGNRTATFKLDAGENVKCTFTNVKRGSINIIKDAQPNDPQDFGFTTVGAGLSGFSLDDDGDDTLPSTKAFTNVVPGDYSVTESEVTGWELTGLVCDGTLGSTGVKAASTANITLTPGGSVTCTYTNVKAGHIIVDKVTEPADDQTSFVFNPSWSDSNFPLTDAQQPHDSGDLKPANNYSVAEIGQTGWDLKSATCTGGNTPDDIDLEAGETVTCTFTNVKRGGITIVKDADPNGPQDFAFTTTGAGLSSFSLDDDADGDLSNTKAFTDLTPGDYVVTETALGGWDLTGMTCSASDGSSGVKSVNSANIHLAPGGSVRCVFTNTQEGKAVVKKVMVGGTDPFTFTGTPSGSIVANNGTIEAVVDPGTYVSTELDTAGWDLTAVSCDDTDSIGSVGSSNATFKVGPGETVICTFTNTKGGHILVDKVTDPADSDTTFEFNPGWSASNIFLTDGSDPADSGALVPGTYSVVELEKAGWDLTDSYCSDQSPVGAISLQPGETVTCTFENTQRGSITVEKQTSPDGGGPFTFNGDVEGAISDNGTITVPDLEPGTYTSVEAAKAGWDLAAITCDDNDSSGTLGNRTATFELDPGEDVTCTFRNTQRGTVTIIKDAVPDSAQDFHYDFTGLDGPVAFDLDDDDDDDDTLDNSMVFENVVAGKYSVTESSVEGWDLDKLDCSVQGAGTTAVIDGATANLTLADGGSITCVYVNAKPSISIVKTAGSAVDGTEFVTPAGPVTYLYLVTNTGPVTLNDIVVTDDNGTPGNTSDDFEADCDEQTTLAVDESMTCTATVVVTANRTNIGTVTGTSGGGTQVSDTDDAVVRIPGINIDKSADDDFVEPNQVVTYTLKVEVVNGPVHDAVVEDTLPAGQTYVPGTSKVDGAPSEPDVDGQVLTWHLGTLDDEDTPQILYDVVINGNATTAPQKNVAELCVSDLPLCDTDDETVTPQLPDIEIVKTAEDAEDGEVYSTEPGNVTYTYVVTNTGPLPLEDVTVTDDNGTPGNTSDDFKAICPETTLAAAGEEGDSMTCTATVTVTVDRTNVAVAHGVTAEGNPVEDDDDAIVDILVHGLVIAKSNDAPLEELELPDGTTVELPTKDEGGTVTYTLEYTFSGDPVTNGIITDELPDGVTYVPGSATSDGQFTFQEPAPGSTPEVLTWKAATVSHSGELSYKVIIDVGASALDQPLRNTASIKSDQTPEDDGISDVYVPVIPLEETAPPTDVLADPQGPSAPGSSLLLILAVLGGLVLAVGFVTPVPEPVRRRYRR